MAARIAVGLAFGTTWVFIEQLIIEPFGIWKYMPLYRAGGFCVYDLTVGLIIVVSIWRASTRAAPAGCG
jgi:hypothetical protein